MTYETARTDLLKLTTLKLVAKSKAGRLTRFRPADDLRERMEERVKGGRPARAPLRT